MERTSTGWRRSAMSSIGNDCGRTVRMMTGWPREELEKIAHIAVGHPRSEPAPALRLADSV